MVVDAADTDAVFRALADPTRRDILAVVLEGDRSVSELAHRYPMSFAAVQKHVATLERAGLVVKARRGREQRVSGRREALDAARRALDALEDVWRGRIDRIDQLLADPDEGGAP